MDNQTPNQYNNGNNNGNNNSGGKNSYPDPEGSRIFNIFNVQSFHLVTHKYTLLLPQKQEI